MSKSVGNIFSPQDLVSHIENSVGLAEDIAVDALRYFILAAGPQRDDADLSLEALWGTYNADLANLKRSNLIKSSRYFAYYGLLTGQDKKNAGRGVPDQQYLVYAGNH